MIELDAIDYHKPVKLTNNIHRLTSRNPSQMTGPGTNTYIVGRSSFVVVDPGPALESHVHNILHYFGQRIEAVLVTHTHKDHSPAARIIAKETGAKLFGSVIENDGHQDTTFSSQKKIENNEILKFSENSVKAIQTPGHVANHICYLIESDKFLITGDHLMEGTTVVIIPPSGSMKDYMDSLQKLMDYNFKYIGPGHGVVINKPKQEIERVYRHRVKREKKILKIVTETKPSSLEELTKKAYGDVNENLHFWASKSLLAHLIKLESEKLVVQNKGKWSAY